MFSVGQANNDCHHPELIPAAGWETRWPPLWQGIGPHQACCLLMPVWRCRLGAHALDTSRHWKERAILSSRSESFSKAAVAACRAPQGRATLARVAGKGRSTACEHLCHLSSCPVPRHQQLARVTHQAEQRSSRRSKRLGASMPGPGPQLATQLWKRSPSWLPARQHCRRSPGGGTRTAACPPRPALSGRCDPTPAPPAEATAV